jgi:serine/threonine protein kinase
MSFHTKLTYLKYIAQGIKFMKDHEIIHLDIKPGNLLFSSGLVKITDFGEAYHHLTCNKSNTLHIWAGFRPGTSIPYAPPESFSHSQIHFNPKMDIFSFGVLMYEILY